MSKYINALTDFGFKYIFGEEENKMFLLDFLNALFEDDFKIADVEYCPTEQRNDSPEDRALIYDIHCTTCDGRKLLIEMQNRYQANFKDRALYYISHDISKQGRKGRDWNYEIDGVIGIFFVNFDWKDSGSGDGIRDDIGLVNLRNHRVFSDKIRLVFLKLPFVKRNHTECKTELDKWLYTIKNLDKMERMAFGNNVFSQLGKVAELGTLTEAQRNSYEQSLKAYRDNYAVEKTIRDEARAEGAYSTKLELVWHMLGMGLSYSQISAYLKLSESEVAAMAAMQ